MSLGYSQGGESHTGRALYLARSKLAEARACLNACPWHEESFRRVERLERELESAVDAHLSACGYVCNLPPTAKRLTT